VVDERRLGGREVCTFGAGKEPSFSNEARNPKIKQRNRSDLFPKT
jgi:hypothetical protein